MNPKTPKHLMRLREAMKSSYRKLSPFRKNRESLIREYVGSRYSDDGAKKEVLVNLLNQTAEVYTMALAANRPRVLIDTFYRELLPIAADFKVGLNNLIKEIKLEETLRAAVLDAFFSLGIIKVSAADGMAMQLEDGTWQDPGRPFAGIVSLDDWVHDAQAKQWHKVRFAGDMYRVPFDQLASFDQFDQSVVKELKPTSKRAFGPDGDQKASAIGTGADVDNDELEPYIDLWDVWLPREGLVVTLAAESDTKPLAIVEWEGPEHGPYHVLSFGDVPDNIMASAPGSQLRGLHDLANRLMRKQSRQAGRQKDIYPYRGGAEDDQKRLLNTDDGQSCRIDGDPLPVLKMGGVDPGNMLFADKVLANFNNAAGNLQALAGLGPQSDTLGQDKLIQGNVSQRIAKMQTKVVEFTANIAVALGHEMWAHPTLSIPGRREVANTKISVDATWTPQKKLMQPPVFDPAIGNLRSLSFEDFGFDIEPYSMAYKSPSERVAGVTNVLNTYAPFLQMLMEQGGVIDFQEINNCLSEYLNLPELQRIFKFQEPIPSRPQDKDSPRPAPPQAAPSPANKTVYRSNRPAGAGTQEQGQQMMAAMLGQQGVAG